MYHSEMEQEFILNYRVVAATTPQLLNEVYRVRYEVYCQKLGYEDPAQFPDGREFDHHDPHAVHCLLQERRTERFVGCVRMILADNSYPQRKLPFETAYDEITDGESILDGVPWMDRDSLAEVSRLAVIYPDRAKKSLLGRVDREISQRMAFIGFGLYLAAVGIVIDRGLDNVFAMMEPRLTRLLKRYGIMFQQVGDVIDYHGRRAPFHVTRGSLIENLSPEMCKLLGVIMQDMRRTTHSMDPQHLHPSRFPESESVEPEFWRTPQFFAQAPPLLS
jgi:N-acyl amino acid synthase of PEP-CTERM/exosortase system